MLPRAAISKDWPIATSASTSDPSASLGEESRTRPTNIPVSTIFRSLARNTRPWALTRKLWSENPSDLQGELKGVATFLPKPPAPALNGNHNGEDVDNPITEMVYKEGGETAAPGLRGVTGMRWTKKYIWRLAQGKEDGAGDSIEVWFVKITDGKPKSTPALASNKHPAADDERDYIFHELRFEDRDHRASDIDDIPSEQIDFPLHLQEHISSRDGDSTILTAHGHHLCINDIYQTTYSFRLRGEGSSTEVVRWASRHIVKGPKKKQVIINIYDRE
ncbi:hypothetical protein FQN54_007119 [Arachnomyces sp. PD_36]|nr:hypothetical protein FQN54_007119 [Arachnomyces sp. PD_36]